MTRWGFRCHSCGKSWNEMHAAVNKDAFLQPKKAGRPRLNCLSCDTECVGEMTK